MAAAGSLAKIILNRVISTCGDVVDSAYDVVMGSWPGMTITTVYVVIVGYLVIMGRAGEKAKEWALSALLLVVVGGVASSYGAYSEWIGQPIYSLAYGLTGVGASLSGSGGTGVVLDGLEETIGRTMAIIDNVNVPGNFITNGWLYIKVGAAMIILALLALALYLAALGLICIAFFSVFMMILAGGPCLWLASFKETRHITWAWVRATLNFCVWLFYLGIVVAVGVQFCADALDDLASWDLEAHGVFTEALGASMLLMALSTYMLLKSSEWAASLTGSTASNTGVIGMMIGAGGYSIGSGLNALGGAMKGPAAAALGGLGRGAAGVAVRAYSAMRGIK